MARGLWLYWIQWLLLGVSCALAYEVPVTESDWSRQVCSGMWSSDKTYINGSCCFRPCSVLFWVADTTFAVTFDSTSEGQLAMVIYEWRDMAYLGKVTSYIDDTLPVSLPFSSCP